MIRKGLEIEEKLDCPEGMANAYGKLGLIYRTRGDLDQAERMIRKALEIDEKLGRLKGMASHYGSLGLIYLTRGRLKEARVVWTESRNLFHRADMPNMAERVQRQLDELDNDASDTSA
jgi:Flp pilus assembly protein TadD